MILLYHLLISVTQRIVLSQYPHFIDKELRFTLTFLVKNY